MFVNFPNIGGIESISLFAKSNVVNFFRRPSPAVDASIFSILLSRNSKISIDLSSKMQSGIFVNLKQSKSINNQKALAYIILTYCMTYSIPSNNSILQTRVVNRLVGYWKCRCRKFLTIHQ